jgi:hypothetical protein
MIPDNVIQKLDELSDRLIQGTITADEEDEFNRLMEQYGDWL